MNYSSGKIIIYLSGLISVFFLISCRDSDRDSLTAGLTLTAGIESPAPAQPASVFKNTFLPDDEIGIYLVGYQNGMPGELGNIADAATMNIKYSPDPGNGFWYADDGREIYYRTDADVYAYYPYDEEMSRAEGKTNLTAYPFQLETDQRSQLNGNDFLWARVQQLSVSNFRAGLLFNHVMSMVEINLRFENGTTANANDLIIHNTQIMASINLRTGTATASGNVQQVLPYINPAVTPGYDVTYHAILVPQTIAAGTSLFTLSAGESRVVYEAEQEITLNPSAIHPFNLRVTYQPALRGESLPVIVPDYPYHK